MEKDRARRFWKSEVGQRLRMARRGSGLTLQQVADKLGHAKQLLSQQERGQSEVTAWDVVRVARLYGCTAEWILGGEPATASFSVPRLTATELWTLASAVAEDLAPDPAPLIALVSRDCARVRSQSHLSARAVAFEAFDASLEPDIKMHDLVIVDGAIQPAHSDFALLVLIATKEIILRRYEPIGRATHFAPPFELAAASPLVPRRRITEKHRPLLVGTVVESIRSHTRVRTATAI